MQVRDEEQPYCVESLPLQRVISNQIQWTMVGNDIKLSEFQKDKYISSLNTGNVFLELRAFIEKGGDIIDVILMDKVNNYYEETSTCSTIDAGC